MGNDRRQTGLMDAMANFYRKVVGEFRNREGEDGKHH